MRTGGAMQYLIKPKAENKRKKLKLFLNPSTVKLKPEGV